MKSALSRSASSDAGYVAAPGKTIARSRPAARTLSLQGLLAALAVPATLYAFSAALLLFNIGGHPAFAYNWEHYTAWNLFPFWDRGTGNIFQFTQGLMTDSGYSPLVVLPAWLGFKLGGVGLVSLRIPIALIAATAAPLLWLFGKRVAGETIALLAAILLSLSPVFLLYGRTATSVGISLVPALATAYVLLRVLQNPRDLRWLVALQVLLVLNSYGYAPIRFLWPISLALLVYELARRRGERRWFLFALVITLCVLPAVLVATDTHYYGRLPDVITQYYHGRGEQIADMATNPDEMDKYLQQAGGTPAAASGQPASTQDVALRLVTQNTLNYIKLLLDWDTRPAITDYWNPRGRLYPMLLVPFFLAGLALLFRGCLRKLEYRVLLALFFGFGLPMLLTSRVHIGRLIFIVPFLFLIVALGFVSLARLLLPALSRLKAGKVGRAIAPALIAGALVAGVGWSTWQDYSIDPPPTREASIAPILRDAAPAISRRGGGLALVLADASQARIESINDASYRLLLDKVYRFVDLSGSGDAASASSDLRPPLYVGGLLDRVADPSSIPGFCANTYFVDPSLKDRFMKAYANWQGFCPHPPDYTFLPQ